MALPALIKYVYNNGTDEVIRKGKKIQQSNFVELSEHNELTSTAIFRIKDDSYNTWYKVHIYEYRNEKDLSHKCTCAYNLGSICRHKAAALFYLQDLMDRNQLTHTVQRYDQKHTLVKMKLLDIKVIKMLCSSDSYSIAEAYLRSNKATIEKAADELVKATVQIDGENFPVVIRKNEERNFDTSCTCRDEHNAICLHKTILMLQLLNNGGANYFDSIRNWDKDKNKLLAIYGYSLDDDLIGKFEFTYKDGRPFLKVLDTNIKRVNTPTTTPLPKSWEALVPSPQANKVDIAPDAVVELPAAGKALGVVFNFNETKYPFFSVDLIEGIPSANKSKFIGNVNKLDLSKYIELSQYTADDVNLLQHCRKMHQTEIKKYLNRNSPFANMWDSIIPDENESLTDDSKKLVIEYIYPKLRHLFTTLNITGLVYYLPQAKSFKTANLQEVNLSEETIVPSFRVSEKNKVYALKCFVTIQKQQFELDENESGNLFIFQHNNQLLLWADEEHLIHVQTLDGGSSISIQENEWQQHLEKHIIPLSRRYKVQFDKQLIAETKEGEPEIKIVLQEKGEYLVFQPVFTYKGYAVKDNDADEISVAQQGKVILIKRNRITESNFLTNIQNLHSNFIRPSGAHTLALKGSDVLKNNWYFLFMDTAREWNVQVEGFEVLKNFRFNSAKPSTKIYINSENDWFDAKVEITFGDQQITVADVKKALANKQQFVPLPDGTLGVLPEEWLKRYSLLFRMGEGKQDKLKLSKYHFSVIDELYEERDDTELIFQLEEKYESIKSNYKIKEVDPPAHLKEVLRPYQVSGFHWLNYLSEINWGGILADDMGLGKTIQALSFLSEYRRRKDKLQALVVCPTTLIYNWENEIKKFAPELTYHIHHGGDRIKDTKHFQQRNIIITTYGTLRSDIKLFVEMQLDVVVLDESQAIKNPVSKVTKAVCLLNAKHKLCMSGTPLQNNTFDIFAQMNFLNPGMLGSMEHFKNEFSLPIDKFGDKERKEHLRKILYPFILRRTKEQVAKDLPAKTEMILWCEMEEEQRSIYDAFRNDYRENILGSIDNKGLQKSQLTILQGLMKLRQICDSPAIMNGDELYPNVSVKIDELARELEENCGDHKVLVFSQFLGMLGLIRKKLQEVDIPFEYFDGSTSASDRKNAIENFQNKDHVRVFLISLKAGGVGLNLTAADYVYIVDPWWNPAVEQQAIDRTHRIGQTKNIFAYRMICKDTVEDKIIQLQERKKQLAKDIVADDDTFVKSLTREDVEYLFS
jgi:non-specific serine/threonine protein kinase